MWAPQHQYSIFPFAKYEQWIEGNWITSLWQLLFTLSMKLEVEDYCVPSPAWANDIMLMDEALRQSYTPRQLHPINQCRLYLQVLTLSDICSANGKFLLPSAHDG
jgi:hypothetical protein